MPKKIKLVNTLTLGHPEFPDFKLILREVRWKGDKTKYVYIKTSTILKSIGVKDSISSLLNPVSSTGSVRRYPDLWANLQERGKRKGAYWFDKRDFMLFLERYNPNGDEHREAWQYFVSWATEIVFPIIEIPKKEEKKPEVELAVTLTATAKMLGIGVKKVLVPFLLKKHFLYRQRGHLLPYEAHIKAGHFKVLSVEIKHPSINGTVPQTMVTKKGMERMYKELEKQKII